MIIPNIPEIESGVLYVQTALTSNLGRIASYILFICVWFFCFTSILGMHFYGEVNICRMFKNHAKQAAVFARCVSLAAVFVGGLTYSDLAWSVGDLCLGLMALINLPSILFLGKYALRALKDYERQEKEGVERFTFDPEALGIPGTEPGLWKELSNRKK